MRRETTQQEYLRAIKEESGLDWDTFAVRVGIAPRAMKAYRLPGSSPGHRTLPDLARSAIEHFRASGSREQSISQQDYLRQAKTELGLGWDQLAERTGISARALKNWRLPDTSSNHRRMPNLARAAIDRLLSEQPRSRRKRALY